MKRSESVRIVGQVQELKIFEIEEWFANVFGHEQLVTPYTTTTQQSNPKERERRDREEEKIIEMIYFGVSDLYQYIVKECDSMREVINELDTTFQLRHTKTTNIKERVSGFQI
jgi:hypothetical protein